MPEAFDSQAELDRSAQHRERITKPALSFQAGRRAHLWMPLGCAERAKPRVYSELPNVRVGLFTTFQQVLWKDKNGRRLNG
jgi:hypothetical protein